MAEVLDHWGNTGGVETNLAILISRCWSAKIVAQLSMNASKLQDRLCQGPQRLLIAITHPQH